MSLVLLLAEQSHRFLSIRTSHFSGSSMQEIRNEQGIPGVLKNMGVAGLIVYGPFFAFDDVWEKKASNSLKKQIEPLTLPAQLAGAGILSALGHKAYYLSSSWFTKSLGIFLQLQSEKLLQSAVVNTHKKTSGYFNISKELSLQISLFANVIAFLFSWAVGIKMTRAGFDPISNYVASAVAFTAVSIVAFPVFAGMEKYQRGPLNSSSTDSKEPQ